LLFNDEESVFPLLRTTLFGDDSLPCGNKIAVVGVDNGIVIFELIMLLLTIEFAQLVLVDIMSPLLILQSFTEELDSAFLGLLTISTSGQIFRLHVKNRFLYKGVERKMPYMDNKITELDYVADGGSSRVLKKMLVINGNEIPVAMKIVDGKSNEAARELKIYSKIQTHENIIKFYESRHEPDGSYTFVLEYGELGSLRG
ncbi:14673_t:CDS:2, partial [Acaulospora morrowiae]